jgi:hypothetical protein
MQALHAFWQLDFHTFNLVNQAYMVLLKKKPDADQVHDSPNQSGSQSEQVDFQDPVAAADSAYVLIGKHSDPPQRHTGRSHLSCSGFRMVAHSSTARNHEIYGVLIRRRYGHLPCVGAAGCQGGSHGVGTLRVIVGPTHQYLQVHADTDPLR